MRRTGDRPSNAQRDRPAQAAEGAVKAWLAAQDGRATARGPRRFSRSLTLFSTTRRCKRPDRFRVVTPGDGKQTVAFEPRANLAAVVDSPETIDEALEFADEKAAISFPFDDIIAADPYENLGPDLRLAFYVRQSRILGGTLTDIVGITNGMAQAQVWIGAEDKLLRMIRTTYFGEPAASGT